MCETYLHQLFSWNTLYGQAKPFIVSFSIRKKKGDVPDCCCWRFVFLLSNLLKLKVTQRLHHVIGRFRFLSKCPIRGSDRKWRKTVAVPATLCCFFYNVAFSFIPRSYTKLPECLFAKFISLFSYSWRNFIRSFVQTQRASVSLDPWTRKSRKRVLNFKEMHLKWCKCHLNYHIWLNRALNDLIMTKSWKQMFFLGT